MTKLWTMPTTDSDQPPAKLCEGCALHVINKALMSWGAAPRPNLTEALDFVQKNVSDDSDYVIEAEEGECDSEIHAHEEMLAVLRTVQH